MNRRSIGCGLACAALLFPGVATAAFIRPNSATAASEFNGNYAVVYAINGSGLPANFGPTDAHASYSIGNNHWTTQANAIGAGTARATFSFNQPVNLDGFYLWNHNSGFGPYYVTQFDLIFKDGSNAVLGSLLNQPAAGGINIAQTYNFAPMVGVRHVDFIIDSNGGSQYTGVAEVAFDGVPEPASMVLAAIGLAVIRLVNRRRTGRCSRGRARLEL